MNSALLTNRFAAVSRFCEKSVSEDTKRTYRRITAEFFAFVGNDTRPETIRHDSLIAWRDMMIEQGAGSETVRLKLAVIRSLFDYLKAAGLVAHNPADTKLVAVPKQSNELAGRALTNDEVQRLLAVPNISTPTGARDFALILTMLRTFMRAHEANGLRLSNFATDAGRVVARVKVKGGRIRTIPIPGEVVTAIGNYLALAGELPDDRVFPITERTVWNIVSRNAHAAGIGHVSPHDLRRTAATRALEQSMSYRQVQLGGGWRDPKTIARYDHSRNNLEQNAINYLDYSVA